MNKSLPNPPDAILFDFDGVIADSARLKTQAYLDIYADEDPDKLKELVRHQQMHGGVSRRPSIAYFERHLFGRPGDPESVERLAVRYGQIVFDSVLACPLIEGAQRLLDRASGRVDMHLISGTPHDELVQIVQARSLAPFFISVHGAPTKKRDAFAHITREHGYRPAHMLAIGDSLTEYEAAAELGIRFLGIVAENSGVFFPDGTTTSPSLAGVDRLIGLD